MHWAAASSSVRSESDGDDDVAALPLPLEDDTMDSGAQPQAGGVAAVERMPSGQASEGPPGRQASTSSAGSQHTSKSGSDDGAEAVSGGNAQATAPDPWSDMWDSSHGGPQQAAIAAAQAVWPVWGHSGPMVA